MLKIIISKNVLRKRVMLIETCTNMLCKKGKALHIRRYEGTEVQYRQSYTLFLTSILEGNGWSTPHPGRFTPRGWEGLGAGVERVRKISLPPGFESQTMKPAAS